MKNKFELEYSVNSSPKILYYRLVSPAGLSEWFADDININGDIYTFIWNGAEQTAKLLTKKENKLVRYQWTEEEEDTYFEFKIRKDDLTGEVALVITDFAEEDEKDDSIDLWDSQIAELKHTLGL
ncbi:MAG TPA: START-like domain-containing protein [Bacteroidales bacterium]|nr:START-like domain-containing protein [Bacteroidales bacterium]